MKSKGIKIPLELDEILCRITPDDKTPGQVLLEIVKDHIRLCEYADTHHWARTGKHATKSSVTDKIIEYFDDQDEKINEIRKSAEELRTMLAGLEIFFNKVKK